MAINAHWSWPEQYKTSDWTSSDGNDWIDANGMTVLRSQLETSTIRFVGGPRHGQTKGFSFEANPTDEVADWTFQKIVEFTSPKEQI